MIANHSEHAPPLLRLSPGTRPRVVVLSASYGAGHHAASREIARTLTEAGCRTEIHDFAELLPWRLGRALRTGYKMQLRVSPDSWGTTMELAMPGNPAHLWFTRMLRLATAAILDLTRDADLVVTTHPFSAQVIGHARTSGRLPIPAVTYLTDAAVPPLWIHRGIDLNLAIVEAAAEEARDLGGPACVVQPLVPPDAVYDPRRTFADPLADLGLTGPRALVTGGSLGVGSLEQTAHDILAVSDLTPVVLCATDTRLRRRLERIPGVVALGWRDDVRALMATSACVVQNAGGFTSLEALASGTPVVTYRSISGHGEANSANLDRSGLIPWMRTPEDLAAFLKASVPLPRVCRTPTDVPTLVETLTGGREAAAVA